MASHLQSNLDTIVAIATPPGRGGVGIIRISGSMVKNIANCLLEFLPTPRYAGLATFKIGEEHVDNGLALYFPAPHSFTGEDVLELQGHGGPVILNRLVAHITTLGARLARPGEFSERAFLNDKIDLVQAEAIADLIDSNSEQAARSAMRSLNGEFSRRIHALVDALIELRVFVEAAIDFSDEDIEFLAESKLQNQLQNILKNLELLLTQAHQGRLLRDGMTIVLAGKPNAGKSSLLNALSGTDSAIVTDIPGTTRDILREHIEIDGMPVHVLDTAGLRLSHDPIEQEGIRRAEHAIKEADRILLLVDATETSETNPEKILPEFATLLQENQRISIIQNKIDCLAKAPFMNTAEKFPVIALSAKTHAGIDLLREHLKTCVGFQESTEGDFIARLRHINALQEAQDYLLQGINQLQNQQAELFAEDLRLAQKALNEITGEFTSDDLLGEIFSTFCVGK